MKLILGDSLDVMKEMEDDSVDLIVTDPPYDFDEITKRAFHYQMLRICTGAVIVFCPPENQWQSTCDQYLFWVKPISTKNTSRSYSRFVEMIQVWNGDTWNSDRHWSQYTNVFMDLVDNKTHPYAKPLSMLLRLIKNHSNEGDTVFDPFMGSGTTLVASSLCNRKCIGVEKEEDTFMIAERICNEH